MQPELVAHRGCRVIGLILLAAALVGCAPVIGAILAAALADCGPVIGTISGAEHQRITIGETAYVTFDDPFTSADRGRFLGIAQDESGEYRVRVYAVKGDEDRRYLYTVSFYEGEFYIREELRGK